MDISLNIDNSDEEMCLSIIQTNLSDENIKTIQSKQYKEVGFELTNIKEYGVANTLINSKDLLEYLNLEGNLLNTNDLKGLEVFSHIRVLNLSNNRLIDEDLIWIAASFPELESLNISYNYITAAAISYLKNMGKLKSLNIGFMDLGNEGIKHSIEILSLRKLYIRSTNITDDVLNNLASMTHLKVLDISYNKISLSTYENFKTLMNKTIIYSDY